MNKIRYSSIDTIRFILACCIVMIHNPYGYTKNPLLDVVLRMAVPIFFMISGYFNVTSDDKAAAKNIAAVKRTLKLVVIANVLYFFWGIYMNMYSLKSFLGYVFWPGNIVNFVVFNESPVKAHLWFLSALLMCYAIMYVSAKLKLGKKIYLLIFSGLFVMILCEFDNILIGRDIYVIYYRNCWFFGIAYFLVGRWLRENEDKVKEFAGKLTLWKAIAVTVISFGIALGMRRFTGANEMYTVMLPLEVILMSLAVKNTSFGQNTVFEKLGREYSLPLYIVHPIVCDIIFKLSRKNSWNTTVMSYIVVPVTIIIMLITLKGYFTVISIRRSSKN